MRGGGASRKWNPTDVHSRARCGSVLYYRILNSYSILEFVFENCLALSSLCRNFVDIDCFKGARCGSTLDMILEKISTLSTIMEILASKLQYCILLQLWHSQSHSFS